MHFPFCVKNDFMSVKRTASFKTRHLAVEFILLGGLRYARVTMPLLLVMKTCIRLCTYVSHSLTTSNYVMVTDTNLSYRVMYSHSCVFGCLFLPNQ